VVALASATRQVAAELPALDAIVGQAAHENFPVALRLLPSATRRDLMAVYGFARLVDDVGDEATGDRLALLRWVREELDRAVAGYASHPVLVRTAQLVRARRLSLRPFHELIEANVQDQTVSSYDTYDELVAYCRLSAVPVGRLVLAIFDASSPETEALSDEVCTALQIVEHLQDVAEDLDQGRIYIPQQDLRDAGTSTERIRGDVALGAAGPELRNVVAVNARRAGVLLRSGTPLAARLPGGAALAVAAFTAGGLAVLDAIAEADHDVIAHACRPRPLRTAAHAVSVLRARRWHGASGWLAAPAVGVEAA
jgi:squalene synthase HpnC